MIQQSGGSPHLELSFLYFFDMFRQTYIGDQSCKTSKAFDILERIGLPEQLQVMILYIFDYI